MKRRREITFETEKIVIRGGPSPINWCDACAALTPKFTAEQSAALVGEEIEQIYRRVERGQVHSSRTDGGVQMICWKSLSEATGSEWQRAEATRRIKLLRTELE